MDPRLIVQPLVLAAFIACSGGVHAQAPAAAAAGAQFTFDIPAQPAADALPRFIEQTRFQLLYSPEAVNGVTTRAVTGAMTAREALARMLAGSGIEIADTGHNAATLRPTGAAEEQQADSSAASQSTIVVTARKSAERMFDVPIAMSAVTGATLARRGAAGITEALRDVPGVGIVDNGGGLVRLSIRGVATSLGANENGYYLDDLPFTGVTVPISPDVRAWDLERVEVLRGPQGTLFGEGSMGGTVRILTARPRLGEFGFAGLVGVSRTDGGGTNPTAKAMVNVPLGETVALRVAATHENLSGWISSADGSVPRTNDSHVDTARIRARIEPVDRLSIDLSHWRYDARFGAGNNATEAGRQPSSAALKPDLNYMLNGVTVNYDFDSVSLFYSYARNTFSLPQTGSLLGGTLVSSIDIDVSSHELRVASQSARPLRWTAGLYVRNASRSDTLDFALFGLNNASDTDSHARAAFAEASYMLPSLPVELTAGLRYYHDRLQGQDSNSGVPTAPTDFSFHSTNPRLSVAWKPNHDLQVYTSASKGFRSGQNQGLVSLGIADGLGITLPPSIRPDSIWTYELGTKASLLDRRLIVEAALFHSKWDDLAVRRPLGATGFNGLINSNGVVIDGIEASMAWDVTPDFDLTLGGAYVDARYKADVPGTGIQKGMKVDEISPLSVSAATSYRFPAFGWQGTARLGAVHTKARELPSFALSQPGDAITTVDARLSFSNGPWTVAVYADNLNNERGAVSARTVQPTGPDTSDVYAQRLRPRTLGMELRYALGR
ncbi:MAG: TonB-dependent receptor [Burkholderiales bacterium]|nr:TonB-dependent receptor [Burkholderiales bacterium]